ncbi:hypothetical protein ADUPG1_000261, partial [Aduncisulcus paluster]
MALTQPLGDHNGQTVISELQRATEEATGAEKVVLLRKLLGKKTEEMVIANRRHALAKEKLNTLQKALDSRTRSYRQKEEVIEERIFELREEIRHMQEDANAAIKNARDRLSKRMEKDKLDRAFSLAPLEEIEKLGSPSPAKKPPMTDSSSKVGDPKTPSVSHDAIMTKIEAEEKHSDPMTEEEEPVHEEPKKEEEQPKKEEPKEEPKKEEEPKEEPKKEEEPKKSDKEEDDDEFDLEFSDE